LQDVVQDVVQDVAQDVSQDALQDASQGAFGWGYTNEVSFIRILRSILQSTFHQNLAKHLTKYLS
jgi:hypothetical protein